MQNENSSYAEHHQGDKIRVRVGDHKGKKGVIQAVGIQQIDVQLEEGTLTVVSPQDVTNFSLAARKAWQTMRTQ